MFQRFFFLEENEEIAGVFTDVDEAQEIALYLREDHPLDHFRLYSLTTAEIENYPDAFEYAEDAGLVQHN
ncbi:hypothetical protein EXM22_03975 [Oceanispirochaeta crateris]|uniref:Uncharacterized protein n=1 Tax=Oceanispirochaeta crateris TaxID=2518645 RepID=A0A5C1QI40_9SPIO|nr:hypothetical protein [Oceanispirochaeta crateris]QEN07187.1 hypothetical protein EXM22_03975 [Oceanispirochaeta crateris]